MAFLIFKKQSSGAGVCYSDARQHYKLGGKSGLIYRLWDKKNRPVECGWSVTANDLLQEHGSEYSHDGYALVIDFHPEAKDRIGLVEIEAIHVYTYGSSDGAYWSPMMLELRDVYYDEDFDQPITPEQKQEILERCELSSTRKKIIEFLYLQGNWNWGRNGSTNAAFIFDDARKYFQRVFDN
jgi:hypothetical protein